ncbi:MAG TPA: hypothetical protein VK698_31725 [Kofleriaceae bacterium]|nr:hypothetical protein [Kofleriaceae bacterium]
MERHARTFESIRPDVLDRLLDVRGSIDHTLSGIPSHVIRQQFDAVLDRMQRYLRDGDAVKYRPLAERWVAFRLGEGSTPENLIHAVVALGDVILDVTRGRMPAGPDGAEFARAVARMNFAAARLIVESLAEALAAMTRSAGRRG